VPATQAGMRLPSLDHQHHASATACTDAYTHASANAGADADTDTSANAGADASTNASAKACTNESFEQINAVADALRWGPS